MALHRVALFCGKAGGFWAMTPLFDAIEQSQYLTPTFLCADQMCSPKFGSAVDHAMRYSSRPGSCMLVKNPANYDSMPRMEQMAHLTSGVHSALLEMGASAVVVYGDRIEALVAAQVAVHLDVPVIHVQAGDLTGGYDNLQRFAISALARLKFASSMEATARARAATPHADPWNTQHCRELHLEAIDKYMLTTLQGRTPDVILADWMRARPVIVMLHPDTLLNAEGNRHLAEVVFQNVVYHYPLPWQEILVTTPCNDEGHHEILHVIHGYMQKFKNIQFLNSQPFPDFVRTLARASLVVGNSSAVVLEAPYLRVPAINVGDRQGERAIDAMGPLPKGRGSRRFFRDVPADFSALSQAMAYLKVTRVPPFIPEYGSGANTITSGIESILVKTEELSDDTTVDLASVSEGVER